MPVLQQFRQAADAVLIHAFQYTVTVFIRCIPDPAHGLGTLPVRAFLVALLGMGVQLQLLADYLLLSLPARLRMGMAAFTLLFSAGKYLFFCIAGFIMRMLFKTAGQLAFRQLHSLIAALCMMMVIDYLLSDLLRYLVRLLYLHEFRYLFRDLRAGRLINP